MLHPSENGHSRAANLARLLNLQEMQDDGCLESACVNASCLALLDASVSLKFLIASVGSQYCY